MLAGSLGELWLAGIGATNNNIIQGLLKVPKRENFSIAFFAQSEPIWICDVGTSKKIEFFSQLTPVFDGFWFFAAY
jgi:hypothetical protein